MNERIRELYEQARLQAKSIDADIDPKGWMDLYHKKFAELIVRECINQAHSVGDLRGANDDVIYGADTAAVKISKHFGVEKLILKK